MYLELELALGAKTHTHTQIDTNYNDFHTRNPSYNPRRF